jgi:PAS domain S-box-containing protein
MTDDAMIDAAGTELAIVDALVQISHSLVCVLAPDGRILRFNHQCEEATGYTAAEVVGVRADEVVIPPEDRELFALFLQQIWETRRPSPQIGQWVARDKSRFLVAWSNRPILADDATPVCVVTAGLRLGERERASAEVRSLHQMLETRLVELTRLAAEQSALRRVATLVATSDVPEEIFEAVSGELARLTGSRTSAVVRYDEGDSALVVGVFDEEGIAPYPVGSSISLDADTALSRVRRTATPQRMEDYARVPGEVAETMRALGLSSSVAAPVIVGGRPWGAVVVTGGGDTPLAEDMEQRVHDFAELLSLAVVSTEARAELIESRARVVRASDEERRRLQRNLHDGAQQRLVSLSLMLRMARKRLEEDTPGVDELLTAAGDETAAAIDELRTIAGGLHPAVLTEFGLVRALESLARRAPFDVELEVTDEELPEVVAAAIYYLVAEALTNAAKHAGAGSARVSVQAQGALIACEVADDGSGGASAEGSGLRGLRDRIEAARGTFALQSPPGGGTRITATFRTE